MRLILENIGILKNADINLNGLTVIAGKNDSGKSTILKTLFSIIKADNIIHTLKASPQKAKEIMAIRLNLVFDANVTNSGTITLLNSQNKEILNVFIKDNNYVKEFKRSSNDNERVFDATFIPSPIIFDFIDFFNSVAKMKEKQTFEFGLDFNIKYPYIMWDLYDKLTRANPFSKIKQQQKIYDIIKNIINGEFIVEKSGKISFIKSIDTTTKKMEMFNTAMGIKTFGIIQLLNQNRFLDKKYMLLFDEPEVHLHPQWEIKMAKLIVEMVSMGIKIVVTSHSPYMLEALYLFSKEKNINQSFYLANNQQILLQENLSNIFETLAIPMRTLKKIKLKKINEK